MKQIKKIYRDKIDWLLTNSRTKDIKTKERHLKSLNGQNINIDGLISVFIFIKRYVNKNWKCILFEFGNDQEIKKITMQVTMYLSCADEKPKGKRVNLSKSETLYIFNKAEEMGLNLYTSYLNSYEYNQVITKTIKERDERIEKYLKENKKQVNEVTLVDEVVKIDKEKKSAIKKKLKKLKKQGKSKGYIIRIKSILKNLKTINEIENY